MARDGEGDIEPADAEHIRRVMSELDGSGVELLDPPPGVWAGIEARLAAERATTPKRTDRPPRLVVEYTIDADDLLTEVGGGWADFARNNDAPDLASPAADRTLWSYMDHDEVRELWQLLVQRVRTTLTEARVPLRCDAPHARRWLEMTLTPQAGGRVHFRSVLVFEESRPAVRLLEGAIERDADAAAVLVCGWCARGQYGAEWLDIEALVRGARLLEEESMPPIAHGICGACRAEMSAELLVPGRSSDSPA